MFEIWIYFFCCGTSGYESKAFLLHISVPPLTYAQASQSPFFKKGFHCVVLVGLENLWTSASFCLLIAGIAWPQPVLSTRFTLFSIVHFFGVSWCFVVKGRLLGLDFRLLVLLLYLLLFEQFSQIEFYICTIHIFQVQPSTSDIVTLHRTVKMSHPWPTNSLTVRLRARGHAISVCLNEFVLCLIMVTEAT